MSAIIVLFILVIALVVCIGINQVQSFKIKLYEGILRNNKDKFSEERFAKIVDIMDGNLLSVIKKMINFKE